MVVLAVGLAVIGVFLAIQQAWSFTHRLMSQAEAQASRIADKAREQFNQQLFDTLAAVSEHVRKGMDQPWEPSRDLPLWLDGILLWDGQAVQVLTTRSRETQQLSALLQAHVATLQPLDEIGSGRPRILHATIGQRPALLGWMVATDREGRPIVVAGGINLQRVKSDLVEPLLSAYAGLEIVQMSAPDRPWSQPLYGAMQTWTIQPTEALVREQRSTILGQTLTYSGLTVLSLATLLTAMWVLVRIMRKEMALAQMKANFVADVSHELRTPLALIRMFSETLQSGRVSSEEKRQEYYEIISRESVRLTNLIDNILDFSRIEAGKTTYSLKPINIGEVVRETYEAYRAQLDHNEFEHHLTLEQSLPKVDADRDAIAQAIINLINNSIKYSDDERYLAIDVVSDVRRDRRGVLISVHDRGIGISPEERARVFQGFFRASDGRVRRQRGTGLGLSLVKHIVDAHHGSLDVESRLVKGSTFRIFLPASRQIKMDVDSQTTGNG